MQANHLIILLLIAMPIMAAAEPTPTIKAATDQVGQWEQQQLRNDPFTAPIKLKLLQSSVDAIAKDIPQQYWLPTLKILYNNMILPPSLIPTVCLPNQGKCATWCESKKELSTAIDDLSQCLTNNETCDRQKRELDDAYDQYEILTTEVGDVCN